MIVPSQSPQVAKLYFGICVVSVNILKARDDLGTMGCMTVMEHDIAGLFEPVIRDLGDVDMAVIDDQGCLIRAPSTMIGKMQGPEG